MRIRHEYNERSRLGKNELGSVPVYLLGVVATAMIVAVFVPYRSYQLNVVL